MKKLCLLILISVFMVGCSQNEGELTKNNEEATTNLELDEDILEEAPQSLAIDPDFSAMGYFNAFMAPFEKPDNEIPILQVDISYPSLKNASDKESFQKIQAYYTKAYESMRNYISTDALANAKEDKEAAEAIEGHFIGHSITVDHDIVYQDHEKVSILIQGSGFSGGAHGNQWLQATTFDLNTGKILDLHEILGLSEEAGRTYVFEAIEEELKKAENKELYYEDALETYQEVYNFEDFYLEDDHIVIFFQSYAIGPYASGIPSFELDYPEK